MKELSIYIASRCLLGHEIRERLEHEVDAILDAGHCGIEPTTVVDLAVTPPVILRQGRGQLPGMTL